MTIVGIDVGTRSLGAVVCDDALALLGAASRGYAPVFPAPGHAEQDPALWEAALAPAIADALAAAGVRPDSVAAVGVSGQLDGCVPVDAAGAPRGRCIIWVDRRATAELDAARAAAPALFAPGAFARRTGQIADAGHMAAKIAWLERHAPGAARYHQPVSYLVERLTGEAVIDPALASTTMLYGLSTGDWDAALLDAFGIRRATLPRLDHAAARAGVLTAAGAALTGLPAGVPVAVGTGDDFATPLGAGLVAPGRVACVLGTGEVVGALHASPIIDRDGLVETHAWPGGGVFVENPGWMAGGNVTWACDLLGLDGGAALDALARSTPPGADGVTFLPTLGGAMTPVWHAGARGAIYGLAPHHGRAHVARAVLEACAFAARDVVDRLAALGVATDELLLAGGGATSALWAQIHADVTGRTATVAAHAEDACGVGAALLASVAGGLHPDVARAAARLPAPELHLAPDPAAREACDRAYARYRALFAALTPLF